MNRIKIRGCERVEEEAERGMRDGRNLGKRQRKRRGKGNKDKPKECLREEREVKKETEPNTKKKEVKLDGNY